MNEEPCAIRVDLSAVSTRIGLLEVLSARLGWPSEICSWDQISEALAKCSKQAPRHIVLSGLEDLERKFPKEALALIVAFGEHNRRYPDLAWTIEVDADYDAPVMFLQFEVRREDKGGEGAFVSCWIKQPDLFKAEMTATHEIESMYWKIISLNESYPVKRVDYDERSEERGFIEQAFVDGAVYVFDSWAEGDSPD